MLCFVIVIGLFAPDSCFSLERRTLSEQCSELRPRLKLVEARRVESQSRSRGSMYVSSISISISVSNRIRVSISISTVISVLYITYIYIYIYIYLYISRPRGDRKFGGCLFGVAWAASSV